MRNKNGLTDEQDALGTETILTRKEEKVSNILFKSIIKLIYFLWAHESIQYQ